MDNRRAQEEAQELVDGLAEVIGELAAAAGEDARFRCWIANMEALYALIGAWPPDPARLAALQQRYAREAAQAGEGSVAARMRDVVREIAA